MCLVYRDSPKNVWAGPYRVIDINSKAVTVIAGGRTSVFSIGKCKKYIPPISDNNAPLLVDATPEKAALSPTYNDDQCYAIDDSFWDLPVDNVQINDNPFETYVLRLLNPSNPRAQKADFEAAKRIEVDGLIKRGTWVTVNESDLLSNADVIGGRFILSLKHAVTPEKDAKVSYIAQGYADFEKRFLVHDVSSLRPTSISLILSLSSMLKFKVFLHDVSQADLQSNETTSRTVFLKPKSENRKWFGVSKHEALKLRKPLYGLCDSGDYWNARIKNHIRNALRMVPCVSDSSLYLKYTNGTLVGMIGN